MGTCQAKANITTFKSILGIWLFIYSFFASSNLKHLRFWTTNYTDRNYLKENESCYFKNNRQIIVS